MSNETIEIKDQESKTENPLWLIGAVIITAIAAFWRFYDLALKPLHHDEGVNGYFLITLFREGVYKYDPSNYHGPTLYYISLAFTKLFGLETFSIRASVAVFGVLMVIMALFLKRYIGTIGSLAAALFLALSPEWFIFRAILFTKSFLFFAVSELFSEFYFLSKVANRKSLPLLQ